MFPFRPFPLEPDDKPIDRIVGTLIGYAIRDGAREIHLQPMPDGRGLGVFYLFAGAEELQEQLKIPMYVWKPLRAHLEKLAGEDGSFHLHLQSAEHHISISYELKLRAQDSPQGEMLVLTLNPALS